MPTILCLPQPFACGTGALAGRRQTSWPHKPVFGQMLCRRTDIPLRFTASRRNGPPVATRPAVTGGDAYPTLQKIIRVHGERTFLSVLKPSEKRPTCRKPPCGDRRGRLSSIAENQTRARMPMLQSKKLHSRCHLFSALPRQTGYERHTLHSRVERGPPFHPPPSCATQRCYSCPQHGRLPPLRAQLRCRSHARPGRGLRGSRMGADV